MGFMKGGCNGWVEGNGVGWGGLMETCRSPGAIIKMAPQCGDEKACSALWVH